MMPLLIDTHVWIWLALGEPKIQASTLTQLRQASASNQLFLSTISLWEVALKHSRGRLSLDLPVRQWMPRALAAVGLQLVPITTEIAADCAALPSAFHGEPADRIIGATARSERLTLVTHDKKLLRLANQGFFKAIAT